MSKIEFYTRKDKDILKWMSDFHLPGKVDTAVRSGETMRAFPDPDWMELTLPAFLPDVLMPGWYDDLVEDERQRMIATAPEEEQPWRDDDIWLPIYRWIPAEERDCFFDCRGVHRRQKVVAARGPLTCDTIYELWQHELFSTTVDIYPANRQWVMMSDATDCITVIAAHRNRLSEIVGLFEDRWTLLKNAYDVLSGEYGGTHIGEFKYRHRYLGTLAAQLCELQDPWITSDEPVAE